MLLLVSRARARCRMSRTATARNRLSRLIRRTSAVGSHVWLSGPLPIAFPAWGEWGWGARAKQASAASRQLRCRTCHFRHSYWHHLAIFPTAEMSQILTIPRKDKIHTARCLAVQFCFQSLTAAKEGHDARTVLTVETCRKAAIVSGLLLITIQCRSTKSFL